MKNISQSAKWFLSFAFAALLTTATFTGCNNKDNTAGPVSTTHLQNPTSANMHAANGADLGHAMDVQNRHSDELMDIEGVNGTGTGLDESGNPVVYVFTKNDHVHGIPELLEDVPTHKENIGSVQALQAPTTVYRNPMWSGISVGNDNECAAGTIACVVTMNGADRYLLSNNHVFARVNKALLGERIDQPGRYDAIPQCAQTGKVATLSKFIPINFNRRATNTVDCAIAEVFGTPGSTTTSVSGYTPSLVPVAAFVGQPVQKTGRTTGRTHGTIAAINVSTSVSYGNGQTGRFVGQLYISSTTFSGAGDSGSLIVSDDGLNNPVGLLFAGSNNSTIANPIGLVLGALGATIVPVGP